jgi:hypothetical protein
MMKMKIDVCDALSVNKPIGRPEEQWAKYKDELLKLKGE